MGKAVLRPVGQPVGIKTGARMPPQRIDFDYLDGLSDRAEREIRATEDALIAYITDQKKRDGLYEDQKRADADSLENKYPALRKDGVR